MGNHYAKVAISCAVLSGAGLFLGTLIATALAYALAGPLGFDQNSFPTPMFAIMLGAILGASKGAALGHSLFTSRSAGALAAACAITLCLGAFISSAIALPPEVSNVTVPDAVVVLLVSIISGTLLGLGYSIAFDEGEGKFTAVIAGLSGTVLLSVFGMSIASRFSDTTMCTAVLSGVCAATGAIEGLALAHADKMRIQIAAFARLGLSRVLAGVGRTEDALKTIAPLEKSGMHAVEKLAKATQLAISGDHPGAHKIVNEVEKMPDSEKGIDPLILRGTIALTGVFATTRAKRSFPQTAPQMQQHPSMPPLPEQKLPRKAQVPTIITPQAQQQQSYQPAPQRQQYPLFPQQTQQTSQKGKQIPVQRNAQFDKFAAHFERTQKILLECRRKIDDAKRAGFDVSRVEPTYDDAKKAFDEGDYKRARELSEKCDSDLDTSTNVRHQVVEKLNFVRARADEAREIGANIVRVLAAIAEVETNFANSNYEACLNGIIRAADEIRLSVKVMIPQFIHKAESDAKECEGKGLDVSGLRSAIKEVEDAFACNDYGAVLSFASACNQERQRVVKLASEMRNCGSCNEEIPDDLEHVKCKCGKRYHLGCAQRTGECSYCSAKLDIPKSAAEDAYKCFVCGGTIKPGLVVINCRCGKGFHDFCAKRVKVCPNCAADLTIPAVPQ